MPIRHVDLHRLQLSACFVNLTRLRYFVAVAERENIVHAARALRVAQPALSRQLKALERDVGTPLFERHARGVRLTAAGRALLVHAREAIASAEAGMTAARQAADGHPVLRVASPDWPHRASLVAAAVDLLRDRMPGVDVIYDTTPWTVSGAGLRSGTIDIGFGIGPEPDLFGPDISAVWLLPEPGSSAVLPIRHPLAERTSLRLADLRDVPALIPPREDVGALYDQMLGLIRTGGYEPIVVPAPLNFSAGTQMVVAGAGWILAVKSICEFPPPGTAVIPLEDGGYPCSFYLLLRADDDRRAVRQFVACMEEVVGGMR